LFDDILTLQPINLFNSFHYPKKNIKLIKNKNIRAVLLSFLFYLSLFFLIINTVISFIEGNFNYFIPLMKLSVQYLLFSLLFALTISFFRMKLFDLFLSIVKIKHSVKFNKKIMKKTLIYYLNGFFIIGTYINVNMYVNKSFPFLNIFIWGLILIVFIYQIAQSIYISYLPYYRKKKEVRNYLVLSAFINFVFVFGLYVFILNPLIQVFLF